ncbi:hypothetical protein BKA70DRAFT_1121506 [Coprinopsis sp. MPI-PUGE-AT-0042]|nr:hypothetical protein BKA70DRAFT_1121506 [Coprinopsis sp. MPI-PUGE-AT-0042]
MLKNNDSNVSGSAALFVAVPCTFKIKDVDIYTPFSKSSNVITFLNRQGFHRLDNSTEVEEYSRSGAIAEVVMLENSSDQRINVCRSANESSVTPILLFHSTVVMNWISFDGVTCLYPALTMKHEGFVNLIPSATTEKGTAAIQKYTERGFKLHHYCTQIDHHSYVTCHTGKPVTIRLPDGVRVDVPAKNPYCQRRIRDLADGFSYSMAFKKHKQVKPHGFDVKWRLCMLFEGREGLDKRRVAASSVGARQVGWVETDEERRWVYTTLSNSDA